jgi:hypothetical protein
MNRHLLRWSVPLGLLGVMSGQPECEEDVPGVGTRCGKVHNAAPALA